jgi:small-conductance mechanosensitive channel
MMRRGVKCILLALLTLLSGLIVLGTVGLAQPEPIDTATVVLDGRPLFEVAESRQITAAERAASINLELEIQVERPGAPRVIWLFRDDLPVILINDRYLMTITQADAELIGPWLSPRRHASDLTDELRSALSNAKQERSQTVLRQRILLAVGLIVLTLGLDQILAKLWQRWLRPAITPKPSPGDHNPPPTGFGLLIGLCLRIGRFGLWLIALYYITNLFPLTRQGNYWLRIQLANGFVQPNLRLGQSDFSVLSLVALLALILSLVVASGGVTNLLRSRVLQVEGIDRGAREGIAILVKYSLIFVGTVVLLQIWGLDLSSLALIASALGVGVGLGFQNIAKDFGSGIVLVFDRPIQVGDFVEFGEFQGTVERIGARSTEIKTLDQVSILVPNSRFLEQEVINWSHRNPVSRIRLPVGVAYGANPTEVQKVLLNISDQHPKVLSMPSPQVFFTEFGESSLNFELLIWIAEPHWQWVIRSELYFALEAALRDCGIEIPFPQRDLHLRSGTLPVELSPDTQTLLAKLNQNPPQA